MPVDAQGIDVRALGETECETVVLTPAHQFPSGVVLSAERRTELIAWAQDRDALIVEDDYDSELRLDRGAVGALQGLAPEHVCHIGSLSKRLAPGLRLGWLLSPSWLTGALTYEKGVADGAAPALEQLALADFIARGELDRHLRRMRLRYRERRERLIGALRRRLPAAAVSGAAAGLFVCLELPEGADPHRAQSAAAALGVRVEAAGAMLVLGYGNLPDAAVERGVELLAEAVRPGGARPPRRGG